jgi:hypothetical protein
LGLTLLLEGLEVGLEFPFAVPSTEVGFSKIWPFPLPRLSVGLEELTTGLFAGAVRLVELADAISVSYLSANEGFVLVLEKPPVPPSSDLGP